MSSNNVDEVGVATSGRFVRNLALSISGGAILTLLGASAAHAEDLSDAGTVSDGAGTAHSGDATAVGNQSGSDTTQGVGSTSGGGLQVINQQASAANVGVAVANTGGNVAVGNGSTNNAAGSQTGLSTLGGVVNNGQAANSSNGTAAISTGDAYAIGNQSQTSINQAASSPGLLGGLVLINQNAGVLNVGAAVADTGQNTATGNQSINGATLLQDANTAAGLAANSGAATNASDGMATISTGNAKATGNKSDSAVIQSSTGSAGGALGGLVLINQLEGVANVGIATANTGSNEADGNNSENTASTTQNIGDPVLPVLIGVGSNSGEASNASDGDATIVTGDATAVGNDSHTTLDQGTTADLDEGGVALTTQANGVLNLGIGQANTGFNGATGNGTDNEAVLAQNIVGVDVAPYVGVASNSGSAGNTSDGSASVDTGDASATGNTSTTAITQRSEANGADLNLLPQATGVLNVGIAQADTGDNFAGGNGSDNIAEVTQDVIWPEDTPLGFGVQSDSADVSNTSDGSSSIATGDATAKGNVSTTTIEQTLDPTGLVIPTQLSAVANIGIGTASTGENFAEGNVSDNTADVEQHVHVGEASDSPVTIIAPQMIGSNSGEASNTSDGTGSISTGDASATGNDSSTWLGQTSNGEISGLGLVINTEVAAVANIGLGSASTGGNQATGNDSQNDANLTQHAHIGSDNLNAPTTILAGTLAASNSGSAGTTSDGDASVNTGDASATGNKSATKLSQTEGGEVSGLGVILNTEAAVVLNAGIGVADSGNNTALGNISNNRTDGVQNALIASDNEDGPIFVGAGSVVAANQADVSTSSDGSADIATGAASATGNASSTDLSQATGGDISGMGLVLNTQVAGVANIGLGVANSGANLAIGNASNNDQTGGVPNLDQDALIGSGNSDDPAIPVTILGPSVTASNSGEASTTSDGSGSVRTGAAAASGNVSSTTLDQDPDSSVDGLGVVIGTQVGGVANVGVGVANSGANVAIGNAAGQLDLIPIPAAGESATAIQQNAEIGSNNNVDAGGGGVQILAAGPIAATNSGSSDNANDGTAKVGTGNATATGNASSTTLVQQQSGNVEDMGLVIGTQAGGVANVGIAIANSGANAAVGNASSSVSANQQNAFIASEIDPGGTIAPIAALGPVIASNSGEVANASDGEACACTGDSTASGNVSQTTLGQDLDLGTTTGTVIVTEAGGVLNAGVGIANSGANLAVGNVSTNTAALGQSSTINDALLGLPIVGPQIASNGGHTGSTSDGAAKVGSGKATATGNMSTTNFAQAATVDSALAVSAITGGTANAGLGLANAGLNLGVGNASVNDSLLEQSADGGGIVSNQGESTNDSDGTATIGDPNCDVPGEETPGTPGLPKTGSELEAEAAIALMLLLVGFGLRRKGQQLA